MSVLKIDPNMVKFAWFRSTTTPALSILVGVTAVWRFVELYNFAPTDGASAFVSILPVGFTVLGVALFRTVKSFFAGESWKQSIPIWFALAFLLGVTKSEGTIEAIHVRVSRDEINRTLQQVSEKCHDNSAPQPSFEHRPVDSFACKGTSTEFGMDYFAWGFTSQWGFSTATDPTRLDQNFDFGYSSFQRHGDLWLFRQVL
jgi:hypothetical protein